MLSEYVVFDPLLFYGVFITVLIFGLALGIIKALLFKRKPKMETKRKEIPQQYPTEQHSKQKYTYQKRPFLLTKNELAFYRELVPAAQKLNLIPFSKVRLADVIEPRKGQGQGSFYKISHKHLDFVLCDKQYLRPVLAIEVDDNSHDSTGAQKRDDEKDHALKSAGLPILRTMSGVNISAKIQKMIHVTAVT